MFFTHIICEKTFDEDYFHSEKINFSIDYSLIIFVDLKILRK